VLATISDTVCFGHRILPAVIYGKLTQHVSSPLGGVCLTSWADPTLFKERWGERGFSLLRRYLFSRGKVERQMPRYSRECMRMVLWKIKICPAGVFTARTSRTCGTDKHRSTRGYILLLQYFERAFMKMDSFTFYNFASSSLIPVA